MLAVLFIALTAQSLMSQPVSLRPVVQAPVKEVYVPTGFDENDTPQFIVEGEFVNACYELKGYRLIKREIKTPDLQKTWYVFWLEAYETLPQDCDKKLQEDKNVPFIEVVTLPKLERGDYEIWHAQNKTGPAGLLHIDEAPKGTTRDSFTYAQVEKASLEKDELHEGNYLLTIEGKFPTNCHEIDLTQTQFINKSKRVIEVLPVIKKFREDGCEERPVEFGRILPVSKKLTEKKYLFHIRIARGKAVNLKVDMTDLKHQIIHKDPIDVHVESAP